MKEKIIERILRTAQVPDLLDVLTQRLSQSDLQSLLLEVYRKRAHTLTPRYLLQQYEQKAGTEYFIVDGGFTDWTQQLLSNRKERLLISGMGSERFVSVFG